MNSVAKESNDAERQRFSRRFAVGLFTVALAIGWAWANLDQGWFPHDEGQLGQAAERVLAGEVPHRDFDDMYTGGLSLLNAVSFRLWGIDSFSMRLMLFLFFIPFVMTVYWLASEMLAPAEAGLATLLAAAWGIPIYSAAMPSWYNLFFGVWASLAVLIAFRRSDRRFLFLAGLCVGISINFKISGLYFLAAALLAVLYRNQDESLSSQAEQNSSISRRNAVARKARFALIATGLTCASALAFVFVNRHDYVMQFAHYVVPFFALTGFLIYREWTVRSVDAWRQFPGLLMDCALLVIGTAIPVSMLVGYFVSQNALGDFLHGTLVLPQKRVEHAAISFPGFSKMLLSLPVACMLFPSLLKTSFADESRNRVWLVVALIGILCIGLYQSTLSWMSVLLCARNLAPFLIVGNVILLVKKGDDLPKDQRNLLFMLTAGCFFLSLIQYPFAAPIYFFYFAPAMLLAAVAAISVQSQIPRRSLGVVVLAMLVLTFARQRNPDAQARMYYAYDRPNAKMLATNRSRLSVDVGMADTYNTLQQVVAKHTESSDTILALPDSPEVSFLTARRPLNGVMYEFFRDNLYEDHEEVRAMLEHQCVPMVVIKEEPGFSLPVSNEFRKTALKEYRLLRQIDIRDGQRSKPYFSVYVRKSSIAAGPPKRQTSSSGFAMLLHD